MKMSVMKLKKTLIYLFLAVFTFVQIFPFYWLVTFSFKSNTEIFDSNNLWVCRKYGILEITPRPLWEEKSYDIC